MNYYDVIAGLDAKDHLKTKVAIKKPSLYRVVMLNDDYTPMDFVVHILQTYFHKTIAEATDIMLHIHNKGSAICGIYTFEVAETKAEQVRQAVARNQHPLKCTIEKDS